MIRMISFNSINILYKTKNQLLTKHEAMYLFISNQNRPKGILPFMVLREYFS